MEVTWSEAYWAGINAWSSGADNPYKPRTTEYTDFENGYKDTEAEEDRIMRCEALCS